MSDFEEVHVLQILGYGKRTEFLIWCDGCRDGKLIWELEEPKSTHLNGLLYVNMLIIIRLGM
jgi:hypothetical protein